ncbi:LuxR C-terminal-related transcriptional regulator [Microbacterium sp. PMB16]|uniref:LuxR C-terminal-related transcriptional regulator n=1 Tax=Microbacterium sp. PMB16 TaxID=3120157 RepID=UPI003F4B2B3C
MSRTGRLDALLRQLVSVDAVPTRLYLHPEISPDVAFDTSLAALAAVWAGQFDIGTRFAGAALRAADDVEALVFAHGVTGLARAGSMDPSPAASSDDSLTELCSRVTGNLRLPLNALLAESALAEARLDLAVRLLEAVPPRTALFGGADHPFLTIIRCFVARVRLFSGDVAGASVEMTEAVAGAQTEAEEIFAAASAAVVDGSAGRRQSARAGVQRILTLDMRPTNALAGGVYLLTSYAAIVGDDVGTSARAALRASRDASFSDARVIDRAICFEILTRAAVDAGDLDAARAWQLRALPLAGHPSADSTVERISSRVSLLAGEPQAALEAAHRAISLATRSRRALEIAEGEILAARARIALRDRGPAARQLATVVADADAHGFGAVRRSAARELRSVGRRLPPDSHRGWEGLSARERDVALLISEGRSNAQIAASEFLSEHTVRIHVSRVLHAFGVPTRVGVASALGSVPGSATAVAELTARQQQIVELITVGASNRSIAEQLAVSESTVEKHVSAIMRRWGVSSRAGIAHSAARVLSPAPREP